MATVDVLYFYAQFSGFIEKQVNSYKNMSHLVIREPL